MKGRNQLLIVGVNSFWNMSNFISIAIFGFAFSIFLTRYLGSTEYGKYGYILSIIAVLLRVFELGTSQSISKYIPKYYADTQNKRVAINYLKVMLLVRFGISAIFSLIFYLTRGLWLDKVGVSFLPESVIILILLYVPMIGVVNTLVTFVGATQNYKKIAIANLITYIMNGLLLVAGFYYGLSLNYFILVAIGSNLLLGIVLFLYSTQLFNSPPSEHKRIDLKESFSFTSLAYVNLLVQYVVWSYSEVFFLRKYSPVEVVGFYTLAFSLWTMVVGLLGTLQKASFNAQFELLENKEEDKADTMTYLVIKYSAMLFIPLTIFLSLLMRDLVNIVYGQQYAQAAVVFPYIALAGIVSIIFGPIGVKVNNHNKIFFRVIALIAFSAVINLALDYFLIPKYQLLGAGYANLGGQVFAAVVTTVYIMRNIKFNFRLNKIFSIIVLNLALALPTLVFYQFNLGLLVNILYCFIAAIIYIKMLKIFKQFESVEYHLALGLARSLPPKVTYYLRLIYSVYRRI